MDDHFTFFKDDDFKMFKSDKDGMLWGTSPLTDYIAEDAANHANRLLNERGIHMHYSCVNGWEGVPAENPDHEALLICSRPVEKKEPECDHLIGVTTRFTLSSPKSNPDYNFLDQFDFCPKCGKDLK